MIAGRPADYRAVVHPARLKTRVFVVAGTPPCIQLRDEAARPSGRDFHTSLLGDLDSLTLPERWVMAVVLCPGDDTLTLVKWLGARRADPARVLLVFHPGTSEPAALAPWYAAGFDDPVAVAAATLRQLARPLGQFVNDWIYADAKGSGWPL